MSNISAFVAHDEQFHNLLGGSPTLELLVENNRYPFAHEAGVYIQATNELFITSNRFGDFPNTPPHEERVQISKVVLNNDPSKITCEEIDSSAVPMGNGGVNYKDGILFCGQGLLNRPSGLYYMSFSAPYDVQLLLSDFYGRPFNSVNDVIVHSTDGSIWFTDPPYGFEQKFRPAQNLPPQIYRYDPGTKTIRAMADGFGHPNGLCFSPDEKTLFVTDTDRVHGSEGILDYKASTIYAFDISTIHGQPFLTNRRLFAMADQGIPDGIKCDMEGNVYSGCGDGVNVWSPGGILLGRIVVEGGAANFCFGQKGEIFILNENRLWRARLGEHVRGALLRI
ncbi:hypothetical protein BGW36DRAFT_368935 [Talaromyces proteolyticus]|uniref:SMP-30/Gluconolactonase/LRE-like region domain-containing protein n=1 Tax=Talaromyces proteolyticus TaxID=1131652 RepID=A0AAD4L2U3_9EURO|nr:uncharacterized protein BGW36DRAFT_368935 [Talaromyces proteolyticus]KAH8703183.1 hypothetical protein BGW36DRAFT_368935 [Talaromyces proteolyticus]